MIEESKAKALAAKTQALDAIAAKKQVIAKVKSTSRSCQLIKNAKSEEIALELVGKLGAISGSDEATRIALREAELAESTAEEAVSSQSWEKVELAYKEVEAKAVTARNLAQDFLNKHYQ